MSFNNDVAIGHANNVMRERERTTNASTKLLGLATGLRETADELDNLTAEQTIPDSARYMEKVADELEKLSELLNK